MCLFGWWIKINEQIFDAQQTQQVTETCRYYFGCLKDKRECISFGDKVNDPLLESTQPCQQLTVCTLTHSYSTSWIKRSLIWNPLLPPLAHSSPACHHWVSYDLAAAPQLPPLPCGWRAGGHRRHRRWNPARARWFPDSHSRWRWAELCGQGGRCSWCWSWSRSLLPDEIKLNLKVRGFTQEQIWDLGQNCSD